MSDAALASPTAEAGFTLLEVLVAAVIAVLALGVLARGAAGGVQQARISAHVQEATSRARSRLAALAHGPLQIPGEAQGDDGGGYHYAQRVALAERGPGIALYDLVVTLSWRLDGGERAVTLRSSRTAAAPPAPP